MSGVTGAELVEKERGWRGGHHEHIDTYPASDLSQTPPIISYSRHFDSSSGSGEHRASAVSMLSMAVLLFSFFGGQK